MPCIKIIYKWSKHVCFRSILKVPFLTLFRAIPEHVYLIAGVKPDRQEKQSARRRIKTHSCYIVQPGQGIGSHALIRTQAKHANVRLDPIRKLLGAMKTAHWSTGKFPGTPLGFNPFHYHSTTFWMHYVSGKNNIHRCSLTHCVKIINFTYYVHMVQWCIKPIPLSPSVSALWLTVVYDQDYGERFALYEGT